ncbi:MAG: flagellar biosynthetic protein FliR [Acidobacteriota bacterium]
MSLNEFWITALSVMQLATRMLTFIFLVPIPYVRAAPPQVKVLLSMMLALLVLPGHARRPFLPPGAGIERIASAMAAETLLGLAVSVAMAVMLGVVVEVFVVASRLVGLNAGFGYVSTIDPNTQADSGVLDVLGGLLASLVIVTVGMDRPVLLLLSRALETPHWPDMTIGVRALGDVMGQAWTAGARLAVPIVVLLIVIDLLLALGSKFQAQLQMITLSFPLKLLGGMWMLAFGLSLWPELLLRVMNNALAILARM